MADESTGEGGARSVKSRRDRLASLRVRHQEVAPARAPAGPAGRRPGGAPAGAGGPAEPGRFNLTPQQTQMIGRVYRMLTQGPDDGSGRVPGTPFLRSGIERLMTLLAQRSGAVGSPGQRVAQSLLRFIEARGDEEAVGGASVEKLRLLAARAETVKARATGRRAGTTTA